MPAGTRGEGRRPCPSHRDAQGRQEEEDARHEQEEQPRSAETRAADEIDTRQD